LSGWFEKANMMATEIERKFLIDLDKIGRLQNGMAIKQGYVPTSTKTAVRVRVKEGKAFLTLKGANKGATRSEFEYAIPMADAEAMLAELCEGPIIDKTRYVIHHAGHDWEVDVFYGDNQGLVVAEVEMTSEDERVALPSWVTTEVTGEVKYYNSSLLANPYKSW